MRGILKVERVGQRFEIEVAGEAALCTRENKTFGLVWFWGILGFPSVCQSGPFVGRIDRREAASDDVSSQ
eukprot:15367139-Ditylum_brightwellii.AAC.1